LLLFSCFFFSVFGNRDNFFAFFVFFSKHLSRKKNKIKRVLKFRQKKKKMLRRNQLVLKTAASKFSAFAADENTNNIPVDDSALPTASAEKISLHKQRPMLSDMRRKNLQNMYNLVGTHSAVKICRWTKSMLRNQGGCYKNTFYNIDSSRCMEATPSLGCGNKCCFCWRGSKHPTIKEWNFLVDEPRDLVKQMISTHAELIHDLKGLPGASKERIELAKTPAHCALSLVGEPIVYPRINEFVTELHQRNISTFLVNNGQFPDQMKALTPICQLYLSVDAMQKDKMKELDRPIFTDFWERHEQSVKHMAARKERTVYRLTMIEGYNMDLETDVERLAEMIRIGQPGFIELKQMTPAFQGRNNIPLRISNVPKFKKLVQFAQRLVECLNSRDGYNWALPSIHEHSHCLLVADKNKYFDKNTQKWKTWIDYEKFSELVLRDPDAKSWTFMDYQCETPSWALLPQENVVDFGKNAVNDLVDETESVEGLGFDPRQKRVLSQRALRAKEKKLKKIEEVEQ
jgi:tRNA wybutosine-synthesizing protein 1